MVNKLSATTVIKTANNTKSLVFLNMGAVVAFLVSRVANAFNAAGSFLGKIPLAGGLLETVFSIVGGIIRVPCYAVVAIAVVVDVLLLLRFLLSLISRLFRKRKGGSGELAQSDMEVSDGEESAQPDTEAGGNGEPLQVDVKEGEELHLF